MNNLKTTNILLLVIVIPLVFYLLNILSFILIPLVFSMFIALLFLPLMRWLQKKKIPKSISIFIVILLIIAGLKIIGELIQLSSREIIATNDAFFQKAQIKLSALVNSLEEFFGVDYVKDGNVIKQFLNKDNLMNNFGTTISFISNTVTMTLMTAFFVVLWLAESINVQKLMNSTIIKQKHTSVKTFMKIEKDLIKFIKVKFLVSLGTGIFTGLACYFFDVSFPIFWGLFAFVINFVQMVGSFITIILLSIFAFVELDLNSILLFFIITITGVQVLFGSILEPIFMGKSFSINIITVLVMLMLWGFIWGVPGMIMSIPITVFIKIILEQYPQTKVIANIISGSDKQIELPFKK
ncbi:AI-2E family transporter [Aureibaculum sp. 2210JD6-5]|uniref:AI-2E family transporter n=1 Tax=Aureibaculum sp. 2210JD6-5 TaxID=3103957 RepID=UPI002AAE1999|nr:AI-2E family transporter [Aureibaculum sp. 2210JD6-5]MDY7393744.1 AI-2E family transporter [Aureibaculum sp. 2210JD6-5]